MLLHYRVYLIEHRNLARIFRTRAMGFIFSSNRWNIMPIQLYFAISCYYYTLHACLIKGDVITNNESLNKKIFQQAKILIPCLPITQINKQFVIAYSYCKYLRAIVRKEKFKIICYRFFFLTVLWKYNWTWIYTWKKLKRMVETFFD